MMPRLPRMPRICRPGSYLGMLATAILLAGCSHPESLTMATVPTLPPPTPAGMEQSRTRLRNDILNARSGLSGAQVGGVVLSLGAAIAVALGLWPRLKEYR